MKGKEMKGEKMMRNLFVVLGLAIVVTGCSPGSFDKIPSITDQKRAGEVTVIRNNSIVGATNSFIISLNGKNIFMIRRGVYRTFKLNEGEHQIGVKCFGGLLPIWNEDSMKFTATPNNSYFLVSPNAKCAGIRQIDEAEAQERIQNSKYVSTEQQ